jgi:hypothetical protein
MSANQVNKSVRPFQMLRDLQRKTRSIPTSLGAWARGAAATALLALGVLSAGSAGAATIAVNSFLDNGVNCTLRKAIENANNGAATHAACTAGTAGSNTIQLGTGTYLFTSNAGNAGPLNLINNSITIQGNGPANTIIDGQNQDYIFDNFGTLAETAITITFTGLTVTRGSSPGFTGFDVAGAMYIETNATAILNNVAFTNNTTTASGGAIFNSGNLTVNNSTFSSNSALNNGVAGEGGAIRNAGTLTVTNSTFNGNAATFGGAIYQGGDTASESVTLTNVTLSGNTSALRGGAIAANVASGAGQVTLNHVTIANNTVTGGSGSGGGIYKNQSANININRSIIANNTAATGPNCNANGAQSFNSQDYNVLSSTTGCSISGTTTNNFVGTVTLDPLASNSPGTTQTISLPAYNPARDRAPTCASGVTTDQRGISRPQGTQCDSGAYEAAPTVPQPPTIGTATGGNAQASVTFTAPGNNGGATIIDYTVTSNPGGIIGTSTSSPIVVSGLTNGTAYTFTVTARNSVGSSAASSASNSVTPATVPGAPTIGTATGGNAQASVTFTAPASNGGSAITSYTATSSPGGFTASGSASPLVVTGLTNGTAYTFTVRATNAIGQGAASAASNSVTPATVPGAPTIGTATGGNAQASVTFTAPASNGGAAITSYTVTSSPGGLTGTGAASPIVVTGLTNGTAYTFTVRATNAVGQGAASAASNSVTPAGPPGAPTIGTATAGNAQASVTFTAPASNGGSAITSYTVTSSPGGLTASGSASPLVVTGLTNGTAYTFTVTATNAVGTGPASAASNSVTPAGVPGAPTIGTATGGNAQATVSFTAPASNGGSAITGYTVTSNPGGIQGTGSASPITVTGLTNGTAYTFTVTATNAVGTGPASAASNSVTPQNNLTLTVNKIGTGSGTITSSPSGITCGGDCTESYASGTSITLTAAFDLGSGFDQWTGVSCTNGNQNLSCTFTLNSSITVTAAFDSGIVARLDFNDDGRSDILWRKSSTGENYLYPMNNLTTLNTEGYLRSVAAPWEVAGVGDFNADGKADILWRNTTTGENYIYLMDGTSIAGEGYIRTVPTAWSVAGVGDFDADGKADIFWKNGSTGETYLYPMDGLTIKGTEGYVVLPVYSVPDWIIAGIGDFNGDGRADVFIRSTANGDNYIVQMDGTSVTGGGFFRTVATNWEASVGDFNGDGRADVLWRNTTLGDNYMFPMDGTTILGSEGYIRTVTLAWIIASIGDFNADGRADILWRNTSTGENYIYPMNGTTILGSEGYMRAVPTSWSVVSK